MRRRLLALTVLTTGLLLVALPAWACGFLIAPNGAVRLDRTATLAAYVDGVEHYVTSFTFQGGGDGFGSIIPLPDVPTSVEKAGSWTLQRLQREVAPALEGVALSASGGDSAVAERVEVLMEVEVEALDITVLKGGAQAVLDWANERGFDLNPDTALPMLDFYADRSPIFLAAQYDAQRAGELGRVEGDGTPVHVEIPTDDPWVPLRILSFDKPAEEVVQADVFLLTEARPAIFPPPHAGMSLEVSEPASAVLLDDLRSDENSGWVPREAWLSYLRLEEPAGDLTYDLAIDVDGHAPSLVDAGLLAAGPFAPVDSAARFSDGPGALPWVIGLAAFVAAALVGAWHRWPRPRGEAGATRREFRA